VRANFKLTLNSSQRWISGTLKCAPVLAELLPCNALPAASTRALLRAAVRAGSGWQTPLRTASCGLATLHGAADHGRDCRLQQSPPLTYVEPHAFNMSFFSIEPYFAPHQMYRRLRLLPVLSPPACAARTRGETRADCRALVAWAASPWAPRAAPCAAGQERTKRGRCMGPTSRSAGARLSDPVLRESPGSPSGRHVNARKAFGHVSLASSRRLLRRAQC
jgi:hypothetical protein